MFSNGRNTQALRLQQFTRTILKFRNRAMTIRLKPSAKQRWVEPNQRSVPNQCSNIRPSLSAHAKFVRPRHPKPRVLARRDFYFRGALESLSSLTGQQMKKKVQAASAPKGCQNCFFWHQMLQIWIFLETVGVEKVVHFFSIFGFFGGSWHMLPD